MRCNQCGGRYIINHGNLELTDEYVGPFTVETVEYMKCNKCEDLAFPPETIKEIEKIRRLALDEKLQSFPLRDFVSAAEAATMLGISRQALHKHRRIRRGFIFQTQFSDKMVYLRKSIELFKETEDGRFQLVEPETKIQYTFKQIKTPFLGGYLTPEVSQIPEVFFDGLTQTGGVRRNDYVQ
ncbi:MAG: hypothetical protein U9N82_07750 [Thermodesulfobacteriota bacterium]|nr:hypothetical protein [Thermodesulfobacteriota bacterium]